jgi:lipoyl(octanoyl) transferase
MALDEALMHRARSTGEAVLRVYGWSGPVLSLGRNQRARDVYDLNVLGERGIGVVRRPTGGRALLHHREVTYSVTAPAAAEPLTAAYARVNALLLTALASLGVRASLAEPDARAVPPGSLPCFAEPARGEITVGGRKIAGSAQWRDSGAMLQHGSIIVEDDQAMIPSLMRHAAPPSPPPATLMEALGRAPAIDELASTLFDAVRAMEDDSASPLLPADVELLLTGARTAHYRSAAWTWRR